MTADVILDIKKAEEEAGQIVNRSLSDSRTIIADANAQAAQILAEAASDGQKAKDEKSFLAERRANADIEKLKSLVAAECINIEKNARAKFSEAVAIIAGRIVKLNVDR